MGKACVLVYVAVCVGSAILAARVADLDVFAGYVAHTSAATKGPFFEGWYFKAVTDDKAHTIVFIPGVWIGPDGDGDTDAAPATAPGAPLGSIRRSGSHAFLMVGLDDKAYYYAFPLSEYEARTDTFNVTIGDSWFTRHAAYVNLSPREAGDDRGAPAVSARLEFRDTHPWSSSVASPSAMGWYAWVPFMECYHSVVSMTHAVVGSVRFGAGPEAETFNINAGRGYIEKDWGRDFPETYVWMQGNSFDSDPEASMFLSLADVPWRGFSFPGYLVGVWVGGELHEFCSYTPAAFPVYAVNETTVDVVLTAEGKQLRIVADRNPGHARPLPLYAPYNGGMELYVHEDVQASIWVELTDASGAVLLSGTTTRSGLEVVGEVDRLGRELQAATNGGGIPTWLLVAGCAAGVLAVVCLCNPCYARHYADSSSVGEEYDRWTSEGVLEFYWGEHIHHGLYQNGSMWDADFKESKFDLIDAMLAWAGVDRVGRGLDVGCGIAGSSRYMAAKFGAQFWGVTLSPGQKARADELNREAGLDDAVHVRVGDALDLPFDDNSFDLVWACESGEHMPDKKRFLEEMIRVARPGGTVLLATWCHTPANEGALTPADRALLDTIYTEWALPFFVGIDDYERIALATGAVKDVVTDDWSREVAPTWPHAVWEGAVRVWYLLSRGPRVVWRTLRDVYAIYYMWRGYETGVVRYGLLRATKK